MRLIEVTSAKITSDKVVFIVQVPIQENINKVVPISINSELLRNIAESLRLEQ